MRTAMAGVNNKPLCLAPKPGAIPDVLKRWPVWVLWKLQYREGQTKPWTKIPFQVNGTPAEANNPQTWDTYENVLRAYQDGRYDGIGVELGGVPGLVGVDLDSCRELTTGKVVEWARESVDLLDSYTEISPSGTGLRILLYGELPPKGRKKGNIEVYETGRFMTITGHYLYGMSARIEKRQEALRAFHRGAFPQERETQPVARPQRNGGVVVRIEDTLLLEKAMYAANGAKFTALFNGDMTGYFSQSEADLALVGLLRFWCSGDPVQIDRLFKQSRLYRDKWDERHGAQTYGQMTIAEALSGGHEVYTPFPKNTKGVIQTINVEVA